jgi:HEAT repeat protein
MRILGQNQQRRSETDLDQLNRQANDLQEHIASAWALTWESDFTLSFENIRRVNNTRMNLAEVQLSIDEMQLADLKQRTTQGQLDRTLLKPLIEKADQLRQRWEKDPLLLEYEQYLRRRGNEINSRERDHLNRILSGCCRREEDIKQLTNKADEIITELRRWVDASSSGDGENVLESLDQNQSQQGVKSSESQDICWSDRELDILDLMRKYNEVAEASPKMVQEMEPDRWVNVLLTEEETSAFREKFRRLSFLNEISHAFCMRAGNNDWGLDEIVRVNKQLSNVHHRYDQAVEDLTRARNEKLQELLPQELLSQESFPKEYPEELEKCIKDNLEAIISNNGVSQRHRCRFVKAIGELGDQNVVPRLVEMLGDNRIDREVRKSIGEATVRLGDQEVALQMLSDNRIDLEVRKSIGEATGRLDDKEVALQMLSDERIDRRVREGIARGIGQSGDREVAPRLVDMLPNEGISLLVRADIAKAIGELGNQEVVPRLAQMLTNDQVSLSVREAIPRAIHKLGGRSVIPDLVQMLTNPQIHPSVHQRIVSIVKDSGERAAIPALVQMLPNTQIFWTVRHHLAETIGELGDRTFIPRLEQIRSNGQIEERVRTEIDKAITKLSNLEE